jgi:predicted nucleotidyltransferase
MNGYSVDEIRSMATPIAVEYGLRKLGLFGSYARGEQTEQSDVDFIVDENDMTGLLMLCGLKLRLEEKFGLNVDIATYDAVDNWFMRGALDDEIVLYEKKSE